MPLSATETELGLSLLRIVEAEAYDLRKENLGCK